MVVIDGVSYDFTLFDHPGGNDIIKLFTNESTSNDLTMVFVSNHSRVFPHNKYKHLRTQIIQNEQNVIDTSISRYTDYMELIKNVKKTNISPLPTQYYWIKVCLLLSSNIYLNYKLYINWNFGMAMILAYINALIGLNIQHDANHGSLSYDKDINEIFGLSQNLIGGSRNLWIVQHMVKHHIHTNILGKDPDTDGMGIVRINKYSNKYYFHKLQWLYTLIGLPLFSYQILIVELYECLCKKFFFDFITKIIFIYLNIVKPYNGSIVRIIETQLCLMFTGLYLSFFFILSHNFTDVNNDKIQSSLSFMKHQIISSCNFDSPVFTYLNGGLNYQIEHHLFPRYHHSKYKELSVVVKQTAHKYNYRYAQFESLYSNFKSTILHLYFLGK